MVKALLISECNTCIRFL